MEPVVFTALRNVRNGRWVVLPLDPASRDDGVIVPSEPATEHDTVDLAGAYAGHWRVVEYGPTLDADRFAPHPPSHWALDTPEAS